MKALVWFLNIIQFLIAYFICYAIYFYGFIEFLPQGVWPMASIVMVLLPFKYYNRFSNYLITVIGKQILDMEKQIVSATEAPETNVSNNSKPKPKPKPKQSKLLYTFFFGYASLKWRRLIRTISLISIVSFFLFFISNFMVERDGYIYAMITLAIIEFIAIGLIIWLIKPFVVDEK
tara:strand:+ start:52 stop:579 length:528 start_codon:yes stop_codon:yes gene_type:complete